MWQSTKLTETLGGRRSSPLSSLLQALHLRLVVVLDVLLSRGHLLACDTRRECLIWHSGCLYGRSHIQPSHSLLRVRQYCFVRLSLPSLPLLLLLRLLCSVLLFHPRLCRSLAIYSLLRPSSALIPPRSLPHLAPPTLPATPPSTSTTLRPCTWRHAPWLSPVTAESGTTAVCSPSLRRPGGGNHSGERYSEAYHVRRAFLSLSLSLRQPPQTLPASGDTNLRAKEVEPAPGLMPKTLAPAGTPGQASTGMSKPTSTSTICVSANPEIYNEANPGPNDVRPVLEPVPKLRHQLELQARAARAMEKPKDSTTQLNPRREMGCRWWWGLPDMASLLRNYTIKVSLQSDCSSSGPAPSALARAPDEAPTISRCLDGFPSTVVPHPRC